MAIRHQMPRDEAVDLLLRAAEQHGLDDVDDPERRVHDLEHVLDRAVSLMDGRQTERLLQALERDGMLAGWLR